jgi:hypothetical protein
MTEQDTSQIQVVLCDPSSLVQIIKSNNKAIFNWHTAMAQFPKHW